MDEAYIEKEDIILPPDPARVMEGLRDTGYDFNTAVADIIDNSISANASTIDILLQMDPAREITVYIADNGTGMDYAGLKNAMKYGSDKRNDPSSLGKFGLGLKTASTAFCKNLSVISRGSDMQYHKVQWDLDHIAETHDWKLRQPEILDDELNFLEKTTGNGTGTLVVWKKTDRLLHDYKNTGAAKNAFKKVEESLTFHISLVYQRFLDNKDNRTKNVNIILNGAKIEPWDPFCLEEKNTVLLVQEPLEIEMPNSSIPTLMIKAYLIPRRDEFSTPQAGIQARVSNDMQGFYVYRENRLIHYGDWMGMFSKEPHGTLLRVDLSFDHSLDEAFHVDIKKSRILLNEEIFNYIKDSIMPAPRRAADERYRKGTKKAVEQAGANAHDASNRNIDEKAKGVEGAKVEVTNETTGEVQVTNQNGTFKHRITIHQSDKPGQYRVIPVKSLEDGLLWEPCITDGKHSVEINMGHAYYQKIYYPVLSENVLVTGMDALLWALAEAELSTFNEETKEQYEEMRIVVSRCLKKLVADLPDPDISDED
ncbi:ATP-binding protein [Caproiciproducens sp. R2]|uniref:ATP-binding protein n=1 Tax=Caproiciproducens sp. R2 TaxID=3435187 RepID=UPI004033CBA7